MQTHEIPRNYRGEGRILYIFSTKGLIYTVVGSGIGLVFYLIFKILGFSFSITEFITLSDNGFPNFPYQTYPYLSINCWCKKIIPSSGA